MSETGQTMPSAHRVEIDRAERLARFGLFLSVIGAVLGLLGLVFDVILGNIQLTGY